MGSATQGTLHTHECCRHGEGIGTDLGSLLRSVFTSEKVPVQFF